MKTWLFLKIAISNKLFTRQFFILSKLSFFNLSFLSKILDKKTLSEIETENNDVGSLLNPQLYIFLDVFRYFLDIDCKQMVSSSFHSIQLLSEYYLTLCMLNLHTTSSRPIHTHIGVGIFIPSLADGLLLQNSLANNGTSTHCIMPW